MIAQTFWNAFTGLSDSWLFLLLSASWIAAIVVVQRILGRRRRNGED